MGLGDTASSAVRPLTKKRLESKELYRRRAEVELQLECAGLLSVSEVLERFQTDERASPDYLFDETIVYLLRELRATGDDRSIEQLYRVLNVRIWRLLRKFRGRFLERADFEDLGQKVETAIVGKIFNLESDSADYAQVNFGDFVITEAKGAWRGHLVAIRNANLNLEYGRESDEELSDPVEKVSSNETDILTQMMMKEALHRLPDELKTIAVLLADGFKVESNDPSEPTISRMLGVTSRTIRNRLKEARELLKSHLKEAGE